MIPRVSEIDGLILCRRVLLCFVKDANHQGFLKHPNGAQEKRSEFAQFCEFGIVSAIQGSAK
jgi:hypothetical protein